MTMNSGHVEMNDEKNPFLIKKGGMRCETLKQWKHNEGLEAKYRTLISQSLSELELAKWIWTEHFETTDAVRFLREEVGRDTAYSI